jgi:hypothetical protein
LEQVATIVTPETLLAWHRHAQGCQQHWDSFIRQGVDKERHQGTDLRLGQVQLLPISKSMLCELCSRKSPPRL